MRNIPVDTQDMEFNVADEPAPKLANRKTGEQKFNQAGVPVWEMTVNVYRPGRRTEMLTVSFAAGEVPPIPRGAAVRLVGLTAFHWQTDQGRQGISFSVQGVEPAQSAPSKPTPVKEDAA